MIKTETFKKITNNILKKNGYDNLFSNILIITDLKFDDNLAIKELINFIDRKNIDINIDIIVTSINNFNKMINNLLLYVNLEKYIKEDKIRFFTGKKTNKKRHEIVVEDVKNNAEFNLKKWNISNIIKNKYSICFCFAPICTFTKTNLFKKCIITLIGHGYNTQHFDENNKYNNSRTIKYLKKIGNESSLTLYISNYLTFNEIGGTISISNKKLLKNCNQELIEQSIKDQNLFIRDQILNLILKFLNNKKYIDQYIYNTVCSYCNNNINDINDIKKNISEKVYEILEIKNDIEYKNTINFIIKIIKYLDKNNDIIDILGINYNYLLKINRKIKESRDDPKIEVTDWSQMLLFLDIFVNNKYKGSINSLKITVDKKFGIIFNENKDNNNINNMYYLTNVNWNDLFI